MKKLVTCIAILTMMASMVSCGTVDSSETSGKTSASGTTVSTEETAETTAPDEKKAEETTTAPAADKAETKTTEKTESPAKEAEKEVLVLNENDRLFGGYVDTNGDDLNLREEPFTTAEVIGSIPNGTQIDVYSCGKAGWYITSFNGKTGYISAEYVKEIESYDPQADVADIKNLVGQWTYQVATDNKTVDISSKDNGTITVKEDSTYTYTDLDGNTHSGTIKVDYEEYSNGDKVPYFSFHEGEKFFIGCYCGQNFPDEYYIGNGGMERLVRK